MNSFSEITKPFSIPIRRPSKDFFASSFKENSIFLSLYRSTKLFVMVDCSPKNNFITESWFIVNLIFLITLKLINELTKSR